MKNFEEILITLVSAKNELRERYHVNQIGVFGSRIRQEDTPFSDVDILVEFDQPVGWEIVDLHRFLEQLLDVKVDLVTTGAVIRKPILWKSIQEDLIYV